MSKDHEIKIDASDVVVTWDEAPEMDPVEAQAMLADAIDRHIAKGFKAINAKAEAELSYGPSKPLESQGNAPSGACSPKSKEETLKLREAWLREAYQRITGQEGVISCGYGKGGNRSGKSYSVHKDETGTNQIFIHPSICRKDGALVSLHQAACAVGLKTYQELAKTVEQVGSAMPPYPQNKLAESTDDKKDGIRQLRVICPVCGYTARTSRKWIDKAGAPFCPQIHPRPDTYNGPSFLAMSGDTAYFQMVESKPIEVDLDVESVTKSGDSLEVKTKTKP